MNQDERELLIQKIAQANQKVLKANTERDEACQNHGRNRFARRTHAVS